MSVRLGVVMDPIEDIRIAKDSTFAMLLAAQARGWSLRYMELGDLWLAGGADTGARSAQSRGAPHGRRVPERGEAERYQAAGDAERRRRGGGADTGARSAQSRGAPQRPQAGRPASGTGPDPATWASGSGTAGAEAWARMRPLAVRDDPAGWYELGEPEEAPLHTLDVILMRKDPPVDLEYLRATWILERAEAAGTLVVNAPRALREVDEKLWLAWFADLAPPFVVAREPARIEAFLEAHGEIVLKPLGSMGGESVFYLRRDDPNRPVILETMTAHGRRWCMAQRFVPEIRTGGDHRILLVDGEPVPYALARIPRAGELRGNLAAGGRGEGVPLDRREREICARLGPALRERGLLFVGLDVIGGWLTEINVTSPTCIRELDALYGLDIAGDLMDAIARRLAARDRRRTAGGGRP